MTGGDSVGVLDVLLLGPEELKLICYRYPTCEVKMLSCSTHAIQAYTISIEGADEEEYFEFLLNNRLAMSSNNFSSRIRTDRAFSDRMKGSL